MPSHIQKLISQGEHQQLDFKFEISDARKIARSMVAFANTDGGILLVGVKDNGAIAGIRSEEEIYMIEAAAQLYCKPEVEFTTKNWIEQGKMVLEVTIPKSKSALHFAKDEKGKWLVYIRINDQNILANSIWLKVFRRKQNPQGTIIHYRESEKALLDFLYFNASTFREDFEGVLTGSYRLQNMETLDPERITELARCYENRKLAKMADQLTALVLKEKK